MADLELALPYPVSVNRIWRSGASGVYCATKYTAWKAEVEKARYTINRSAALLFVGPVAVSIELLPHRPKRWCPGDAVRRMDVDAPIKGCLDALQQARVFSNDQQVVDVRCRVGCPVPGGALMVRVTQA